MLYLSFLARPNFRYSCRYGFTTRRQIYRMSDHVRLSQRDWRDRVVVIRLQPDAQR
jgi:hypothetical protein